MKDTCVWNKKIQRTIFLMLFLVIAVFFLPETTIKVEASSYDSWVEGSTAYEELYGSQSLATTTAVDERTDANWFEELISGGMLVELEAANWIVSNLNMTVDNVILGRLVNGTSVNLYAFELTDKNPYGIVGAICFAFLRNFVFGLMAIYLIILIFKQLFTSSGQERANFKTEIATFILYYILLYLIPPVVDLLIFLKDSMMAGVITQVTSSTGNTLGFSLISEFKAGAYESMKILDVLLYTAACMTGVVYAFSYIKIAFTQTALFIFFPLVALLGNAAKKMMGSWSTKFFSNLAIPLVDCMLLMIPICFSLSGSGDMEYAGLIKLIMFFMIAPARKEILNMLSGGTGSRAGFGAMGMVALNLLRGSLSNSGSGREMGRGARLENSSQDLAEKYSQKAEMDEALSHARLGGTNESDSKNPMGLWNSSSLDKVEPGSVFDENVQGPTGESLFGSNKEQDLQAGLDDSENLPKDAFSIDETGSVPLPNRDIDFESPYSLGEESNVLPNEDISSINANENMMGSNAEGFDSSDSMSNMNMPLEKGNEMPNEKFGMVANRVSDNVGTNNGVKNGVSGSSLDKAGSHISGRQANLQSLDYENAMVHGANKKIGTEMNYLKAANTPHETAISGLRKEKATVQGNINKMTKDLEQSRATGDGREAVIQPQIASAKESVKGIDNKIAVHMEEIAKNNKQSKAVVSGYESERGYHLNKAKEIQDKEMQYAKRSASVGGSDVFFKSENDYQHYQKVQDVKRQLVTLKNFDSGNFENVLSNREMADLYQERARVERNENYKRTSLKIAATAAIAPAVALGAFGVGANLGPDIVGPAAAFMGMDLVRKAKTGASMYEQPGQRRAMVQNKENIIKAQNYARQRKQENQSFQMQHEKEQIQNETIRSNRGRSTRVNSVHVSQEDRNKFQKMGEQQGRAADLVKHLDHWDNT